MIGHYRSATTRPASPTPKSPRT